MFNIENYHPNDDSLRKVGQFAGGALMGALIAGNFIVNYGNIEATAIDAVIAYPAVKISSRLAGKALVDVVHFLLDPPQEP